MEQLKNKVLIVEDNKEHFMALAIKLKSQYEVAWAEDAVIAMTVADREKPDVILLDLGLPGGDGFMVINRLKSHPSTLAIPIIIVTAREPVANRAAALAAGATLFLQKPVKTDELNMALRTALTVGVA